MEAITKRKDKEWGYLHSRLGSYDGEGGALCVWPRLHWMSACSGGSR